MASVIKHTKLLRLETYLHYFLFCIFLNVQRAAQLIFIRLTLELPALTRPILTGLGVFRYTLGR